MSIKTVFALMLLLVGPVPIAGASPSDDARMPSERAGDAGTAGDSSEYPISPQESTLTILVHSAGALARFGHNHVITGPLSGRVSVARSTEQPDFALSFPVAQLIVDDAQARRAAGADFTGSISESDRLGTRRNMLRPEVLDAQNYPLITVQSVRTTGSLPSPQITIRVTIKGVSRVLLISPEVKYTTASLSASGEFDILQSDFGIQPFSIALGALRTEDRLHVKFSVVAFNDEQMTRLNKPN